ncbi:MULTISPECIES: pseudouridine synthase [unclassified Breznakia]|uniref:pseudouridine synthase n=1 Tax=unclassified Breznakia TaxID=2623764 RepID=UPI002472F685|nr:MULTISPECIES: pseudouridine synthase [unclassified Breznakia]MDH6368134.1 23S rRNA pseudouridine2604 synthase [Breznakia sp. PH1-1]MDH6405223.1 23S rRNA pseudouridine2604 synthase [Breznakia sp. PF1-11]MDH6412924.1 23S rRNA pseudouridine2604 synthase [Breznakia sp. PFB1-11]MDH6415286.1 23S rRNA pseudouridine2604 synthase [Breznakia sp. PFB1-14]MDH6417608.1 23S rRNA pseudouridine2604 synthase [Breznakia sp. PFB1-4]
MKHATQFGKEKQVDQKLIQHEIKDAIRLNKYISSSGYCSRREADKLIEQGLVKIDGITATMGSKVQNSQQVTVKETIIQPTSKLVYIALHKPKGITCTTDKKDATNIVDYMNYETPIFPIGRLDKDTTGLILLTNDGDIVNKILRSEHAHEKEYIVQVNRKIKKDFLDKMASGVTIYNAVTNAHQTTKPAKVKQLSTHTFSLIISEGMNRQIRRMCTALGYHVDALQRVRIMNIKLANLPEGMWRYLSEDELNIMNQQLQK